MPKTGTFKDTNAYGRICVTVNLPDGKTWEDYNMGMLRVDLNASYMIMGKETGGTTERKHYQGYLEFASKKKGAIILKAFRKRFPLPISVHLEAAAKDAETNIAYCSKEDPYPFIFGEPRLGQGARNDLKEMFAAAKRGDQELDIAESNPQQWALHRKALADYRMLCEEKRNWPMQLIFLWGPTGTGKTMHAQELNPASVYWTGAFLNGFKSTDRVLLFDDFDDYKMDWQMFLTMTDRYPMSINVKGGCVNFAPRIIIFTSNSDPMTWYDESKAKNSTKEAIKRRIKEFGDVRFLGTLIPKHQNILTDFLIRKDPPVVIAPVVEEGGAPGAPADVTAVPPGAIDLTDDEEDCVYLGRQDAVLEDYYSDSQHSGTSNTARVARRRHIVKLEKEAADGAVWAWDPETGKERFFYKR